MSGVDNHRPGLAVAALTHDEAYVELVADGLHVERSVWPIILRAKPANRLVLVSDAIGLAGTGDGRMRIGELEVEVRNGACRLVSDGRLAGSVIALDTAVRNLAASGVPLPAVVRAASRNPLQLLGVTDRGTIAPGQRADLVELSNELQVLRVMKAGRWYPAAGATDVVA
jgi:N-acetylglucosamine-6-phosphate deacetylase